MQKLIHHSWSLSSSSSFRDTTLKYKVSKQLHLNIIFSPLLAMTMSKTQTVA